MVGVLGPTFFQGSEELDPNCLVHYTNRNALKRIAAAGAIRPHLI